MNESVLITKVWYDNTVKNEQSLKVEYTDFIGQTRFNEYFSNKKPISYFCSNPEEPRLVLQMKNNELGSNQRYVFIGNLFCDDLGWFSVDSRLIAAIDLFISSCFVKKTTQIEEYGSLFSSESNCQKRNQEPIYIFSSSNQKQKVHT